MIFCPPIHFTIPKRVVVLCAILFSFNFLSAQAFVFESTASGNTSDNDFRYKCLSELTGDDIQEMTMVFSSMMGVDSAQYDASSHILVISCDAIIKEKDLKPLFAMLQFHLIGEDEDPELILQKINK